MRKKLNKVAIVLMLLFVFAYINNSSVFVDNTSNQPFLLAHRGLAQTFPMVGITANTNTAEIIYEPEHSFIENTIDSIAAAFAAGADMVELDIHPTVDGQFAVFHDWIIDYRTDGTGVTREHSMAQLKELDVGYGYTADGGRTFPFRGKGIGLMPSLDEVLETFPEHELLIHIKSNDPKEGELLANYLSALSEPELSYLTVYGGDDPIAILQERLPQLRVMSKNTMQKALLAYMVAGWTGYVPSSMQNAFLIMPQKYTQYLWGWPHRFIQRMEKVNTHFILVNGDGQWAEGFDTIKDLDQLPRNYSGGIWTNRIDIIAPVFIIAQGDGSFVLV
jgi:glycerophosphoryl diester phosphodiesterase